MKLWKKYLLKEILKVLFLFVVCFFGLYVLVDYSSHSSHLLGSKFTLLQLLYYYFCEFSQRLDVLLPFALLIATIRTTVQLNVHRELTALLASGLKLTTLLRPFLLVGLSCVALLYFNTEVVAPRAFNHLRVLHEKKGKKKRQDQFAVHALTLKDQSTLIYRDYSPKKATFIDLFWVRSFDDIVKMQRLSLKEKGAEAYFVEHLARDPKGRLSVASRLETEKFSQMRFNKKYLLSARTPAKELSLSKLWKKYPKEGVTSNKDAERVGTFYKKLFSPWLCLFGMLIPLPSCLRFSRYFPTFFIYALSIPFLVAAFIVLDAANVLAGRQVFTPEVALGIPCGLLALIALIRYLQAIRLS